MKLKAKILASLAALLAAGAAHASVLTFDGLTGNYGDGAGLGSGMTQTNSTLSYTEGGYVFTLNTPATYQGGAHIGDAGSVQTYNWHDDGNNGLGAYVTLTATNGAVFNLIGFDYDVSGTGLTVSANGYTDRVLNSSGNIALNFYNVSSVTFRSNDYTYNQLDNVELTTGAAAVPEPGSFALLGLGLVGAGLARRKAGKK